MQFPIYLLWASSLDIDIRSIVRLEIIPRVCPENPSLHINQSPICSQIQNFPYLAISPTHSPDHNGRGGEIEREKANGEKAQSRNQINEWQDEIIIQETGRRTTQARSREISTDNRNGFSDSRWALRLVNGGLALDEGGV